MTFTLIKDTKGKRFGGYRKVAYGNTHRQFMISRTTEDPSAFLFSLDR